MPRGKIQLIRDPKGVVTATVSFREDVPEEERFNVGLILRAYCRGEREVVTVVDYDIWCIGFASRFEWWIGRITGRVRKETK